MTIKLKNIIYLSTIIVILAVFNFSIYKQEKILKHDTVFRLELAPVDPRSLLQGDYMKLNYTINIHAPKGTKHIIISLDKNKVANYKAIYNNQDLTKDELMIKVNPHTSKITVDTFLFQEGQASLYNNAKYAEFTVDTEGNYILTDLLDKDFKKLTSKK